MSIQKPPRGRRVGGTGGTLGMWHSVFYSNSVMSIQKPPRGRRVGGTGGLKKVFGAQMRLVSWKELRTFFPNFGRVAETDFTRKARWCRTCIFDSAIKRTWKTRSVRRDLQWFANWLVFVKSTLEGWARVCNLRFIISKRRLLSW